MDPKSLLEIAAQYGALGILLLVVGYAYYKKDRALEEREKEWHARFEAQTKYWQERVAAEYAARINDAESYHERMNVTQEKTLTAIHSMVTASSKLTDAVDFVKEGERERERDRRNLTGPQRPPR